jgi:hypothetical protein
VLGIAGADVELWESLVRRCHTLGEQLDSRQRGWFRAQIDQPSHLCAGPTSNIEHAAGSEREEAHRAEKRLDRALALLQRHAIAAVGQRPSLGSVLGVAPIGTGDALGFVGQPSSSSSA